MAMTEKQIFKRMNDAYVNEYGDFHRSGCYSWR